VRGDDVCSLPAEETLAIDDVRKVAHLAFQALDLGTDAVRL
jgi:hypothetical protein